MTSFTFCTVWSSTLHTQLQSIKQTPIQFIGTSQWLLPALCCTISFLPYQAQHGPWKLIQGFNSSYGPGSQERREGLLLRRASAARGEEAFAALSSTAQARALARERWAIATAQGIHRWRMQSQYPEKYPSRFPHPCFRMPTRALVFAL